MADRVPGDRLGLWPPLSLMTAVQFSVTMATVTMAAIAPVVAATLDLPPSFIGYQVSLIYSGGATMSLFGGSAVRRYGACLVSQLALLVAVAGCALLATGWLALAPLGSIMVGFAYGLTNPAASHLLARIATSRLNLIFSLKQTGVPLGGTAAGALMPLIALTWGWRAALLVLAGVLALLVLALVPFRARWDTDRDPDHSLVERPLIALRLVLGDRVLRWLGCAAFAFAAAQLCLSSFIVTALVEDVGMALVAAGLMLSVTQAAGICGRLFWGWLADWIGDGILVLAVIGLVMTASGLAIATIGPTWPIWAIGLVFAIFGATASGWNGVYLAVVARTCPPQHVGAATGGALCLAFLGVVAGPAAFAGVHTGFEISLTATFGWLSLVAVGGSACVWLGRRGRGRP